MHADQLFADRFDQQRGRDRRINAAGQREQHLFVTDLFSQFSNLFFDKSLRKRLIGDAFHGFRTFVSLHTRSLRISLICSALYSPVPGFARKNGGKCIRSPPFFLLALPLLGRYRRAEGRKMRW